MYISKSTKCRLQYYTTLVVSELSMLSYVQLKILWVAKNKTESDYA